MPPSQPLTPGVLHRAFFIFAALLLVPVQALVLCQAIPEFTAAIVEQLPASFTAQLSLAQSYTAIAFAAVFSAVPFAATTGFL